MANKIPGLLVNTGLRFHISSWAGLLTLQILSVALLILLPAFFMGMVMPLVLVWAGTKQNDQSVQLVGRSYAVNTLGAIAGAFVAGFVLVPKLTTRFTILLRPFFASSSPQRRTSLRLMPGIATCGALWLPVRR